MTSDYDKALEIINSELEALNVSRKHPWASKARFRFATEVLEYVRDRIEAIPGAKSHLTIRRLPWICGDCGREAVQNLRKYEGDALIGTCDECGAEWVS